MMSDILANAGWFFFAAYSAVVAAVSFAAFGGDVLPAKAPAEASQKNSSDRVHSAARGCIHG